LAEGSLTPKMSASQKETGTEKRIPFSVPAVVQFEICTTACISV